VRRTAGGVSTIRRTSGCRLLQTCRWLLTCGCWELPTMCVALRSPCDLHCDPHSYRTPPPHLSQPLYTQPPTTDSTTARRLTGDRRFGLDAHHVCHPLDRAQRPSSLVEQPHRIHRQQGQWCATRQQIGNKMGDSPLALLDSIFVHHTITD